MRYRIEPGINFTWSKYWTYNIFRAFEMLFGRKYGVRPEMLSHKDSLGREYKRFFTLEARLAHWEYKLRSFFRLRRMRVCVPLVQTPLGNIPASPFLFAVGFDAITQSNTASYTNTTPLTTSHTVTGSDTLGLIIIHLQTAGGTISSCTWNSAATTAITSIAQPSQGTDFLRDIVAPTTGTVSVGVSNASGFWEFDAISYSGCNQSTTLDATNTSSGSGGATVTTSITPVGTGCWGVSFFHNDSGSVSVNSGMTLRGSIASDVSGTGDTNATISGATNMVWNSFNNPGVNWSWITCSISPPVSSKKWLPILGVGT